MHVTVCMLEIIRISVGFFFCLLLFWMIIGLVSVSTVRSFIAACTVFHVICATWPSQVPTLAFSSVRHCSGMSISASSNQLWLCYAWASIPTVSHGFILCLLTFLNTTCAHKWAQLLNLQKQLFQGNVWYTEGTKTNKALIVFLFFFFLGKWSKLSPGDVLTL